MGIDSMSPLARATKHFYYESVNIFAILLNSAFIGVETQMMAERAENDALSNSAIRSDTPAILMVIAFLFNVVFTVDLVLRWYVEGFAHFWMTDQRSWNLLDFVVVAVGILDCVFMIVSLTGRDGSSVARESTVIRI